MQSTLPAPVVLEGPADTESERPQRVPRQAKGARRSQNLALGTIAIGVLVFASVPFVTTAIDAARHHRVFLGVTGQYPMDVLQYLAWIRDAHNGLIRNLFGSARDGAVFLHPTLSPSGWLQAATGVSDAAIMAFWTAVGAAVMFVGCLRLATRHIRADRPWRRCAAVLLALFGGLTPVALYLQGSDSLFDFARAGGDIVPVASLWEYSPLAIALGLMPFAIDGVERLLAGQSTYRRAAATALLGLVIAWLHPWQGATFLVVVIGLALWRRHDLRGDRERSPAKLRPLLLVALATAVPVGYYLLLSRIDPGWAVSERTSVSASRMPWREVAGCLLPLALIGALAARRVIHDPTARGLVLWPAATLLIAGASPSGQTRAIAGVAVPIGVLVVRAWPTSRRARHRVIVGAAALAVALVPTVAYAIDVFGNQRTPSMTAYEELNRSDVRAVQVAGAIAGSEPILSTVELGTAIPALSDKPTWVGHPIWTPDFIARLISSTSLFSGSMTALQARAFVSSIGTRALVEPCGYPARLEPALAPLGFHEVRVGCAHVYERGPGLDKT
jgi:hypothetical protein